MRYMTHAATGFRYRTDGVTVWIFTGRSNEWVLDDMPVNVFDNILTTGNGYPN